MTEKSQRRAFATRKWPVFGKDPYSDERPPKAVLESPYYWWFRFLRMNEGYRKALSGGGTKELREVASDLGNVSDTDFKKWWIKVSPLFAEPLSSYGMFVADKVTDIPRPDSKSALTVVVPLDWTAIRLKRRFSQLVDSLVKDGRVRPAKRGFRAEQSRAKYQLGRKWNTTAMNYAYRIYALKQRAKNSGDRLVWADAAIRAELPSAKGLREGDRSAKAALRREVLVVLAKRHYKRAERFIAASASRRFP